MKRETDEEERRNREELEQLLEPFKKPIRTTGGR
jgi:hypothetical protein